MKIEIDIEKKDLDFNSIGINIKDIEAKYNDTNHIFKTPYIIEDENPDKYPTTTIRSVTRINPSGKIVVHDDETWENIEDFKAKQLFDFICSNINIWKYKIKSKTYGYICGTKSPKGNYQGQMSANGVDGYELWQRIELINN